MPQPFAVPVTVTPKSIVYLRPDTIGDLIIFSSALAELQTAWPKAQHTLIVRSGYETLAPLFPASLRWHVAQLNPFKQKPSTCRAELAALLADIEKLKPDLIVAPTLNRTWLEAAVAAHFPKIRSVVLGAQDVDPIFAAALRLELGVAVNTAFAEVVAAATETTDWENQHRLVDHLLGRIRPTSRPLPAVTIPAAASAQAKTILTTAKLTPRGLLRGLSCGARQRPSQSLAHLEIRRNGALPAKRVCPPGAPTWPLL